LCVNLIRSNNLPAAASSGHGKALRCGLVGLHVGQHPADGALIDIGYQGRFAQITFPLGGFFGQYVRGKGLAATDFTATGCFEPFGCTSVRFHFRHGCAPCITPD
jgi:hypothetical protein